MSLKLQDSRLLYYLTREIKTQLIVNHASQYTMTHIVYLRTYVPGPPDLHLGDHLCRKKDGDDRVDGEGDVDELVAHLEGLRSVHAH